MGHPGFKRIRDGLDNGNYPDTDLTSEDVRIAEQLFGECLGCAEGKMRQAPTPKVSLIPPPKFIGQRLCCDLIAMSIPGIGGITQLLPMFDRSCGYLILLGLQSKSQKALQSALDTGIAQCTAYGHPVEEILVDHENNLRSCKTHLDQKGVKLIPMPAGYHEKISERYTQTLRARQRSIIASLQCCY
jgi:hypothetical protein